MRISKLPGSMPFAPKPEDKGKSRLIDQLLENTITELGLMTLREQVDAADLSGIIQRIYDLNEKYILEISTVDGVLRKLNEIKNGRRNRRFHRLIKKGFRDIQNKHKKIILAEGNSWFNYPIVLTDIIDRISMENNFAVFSLASGGDWLLNMLTGRHYVEELSVLHPDVFLISGGGNDLVGSSRLATMMDPTGNSQAFLKNEWAKKLIENADKRIGFDSDRFYHGAGFISNDFFSLLMFFHLQYYTLVKGILKNAMKEGDKFFPIQIITQGYDYGIPSYNKNFGFYPGRWFVPFIRIFLGHGHWLKTPMQIRGVMDPEAQKDIIYVMIYLFNEMMIGIGRDFNRKCKNAVSHIDSRDSVGALGWTDELHPKPPHFIRTAEMFIACINKQAKPHYENVYIVKPGVRKDAENIPL